MQNTIKTAVVDMLLWPSRMVFPILEGDYRDLEFLPTGVLTVTIIEATGLMNTDIVGKSDPFVFAYGEATLFFGTAGSSFNESLHPGSLFRASCDPSQSSLKPFFRIFRACFDTIVSFASSDGGRESK